MYVITKSSWKKVCDLFVSSWKKVYLCSKIKYYLQLYCIKTQKDGKKNSSEA